MNLKVLREAQKLTQEQVGEKLGVLGQQVFNWETNRAPIPLKHAKKYATILKVPKDNMVQHILNSKVQRMLKAATP